MYLATREDLYKLVMRVVNSTSLLEERHTGDKMTKAGTRVTSQEMRKQVTLVCVRLSISYLPTCGLLWRGCIRMHILM